MNTLNTIFDAFETAVLNVPQRSDRMSLRQATLMIHNLFVNNTQDERDQIADAFIYIYANSVLDDDEAAGRLWTWKVRKSLINAYKLVWANGEEEQI